MMIFSIQLSIDTACLVTGQVKDRVQALERTFQDGGASDVSMGQVAVWCVLATSLILLLWQLGKKTGNADRKGYHSTSRLFGELCRLHRLDWPSRRLLKQLAQARQLEPPTRLFIESSWFDESQLPVSLHPFRGRLAEIKRRLFGTDECQLRASKRDSTPAPTHPCAPPRD